MIIKKPHHRARVVKGWAFMDLTESEVNGIRRFLDTGNTGHLPTRFRKKDYSIYTQR